MLLSYGLKAQAADNCVAKIFVKSLFEDQFTVTTWPSKSIIENIEKIVNSKEHSPQKLFQQIL